MGKMGPYASVSMAIIFLILKLPAPKYADLTLREKIAQIDPLVAVVFLPAIMSLILALH
jgi:hypothetical protein